MNKVGKHNYNITNYCYFVRVNFYNINHVESFSAVDSESRKAWTDSQHCHQRGGVQVPAEGDLCQEGRESGGE